MPKTLNKDGTPRKTGSGKTKGAGCFSSTNWAELKNFIAEDVQIPVSRVWLRNIGAIGENEGKTSSNLFPSPALKSKAMKQPQEKPPKKPPSPDSSLLDEEAGTAINTPIEETKFMAPISVQEWESFTQTGNVSPKRLRDIVKKYTLGLKTTPQELMMFSEDPEKRDKLLNQLSTKKTSPDSGIEIDRKSKPKRKSRLPSLKGFEENKDLTRFRESLRA